MRCMNSFEKKKCNERGGGKPKRVSDKIPLEKNLVMNVTIVDPEILQLWLRET